jgi:hypothetical protein
MRSEFGNEPIKFGIGEHRKLAVLKMHPAADRLRVY